ncbi:uncharacterized protein LOC143529015 [Bidens hawaiensis]|uniref:uncharacterized protein LOC143529015 n=1 Tax=Bidens hawaiensis TaxID=980011 RepID=UPI004049F9AF
MDPSPSFSISGQPSSSRRLPPPCWSNDETVALIESYRDKWYSLCRGNLRANHWQEVADGVAYRCPVPSGQPSKTSIQCRHKMEKLRKRYRSEIQRIGNPNPRGHRNPSAWVHFNLMDSMELGLSVNDRVVDRINRDDDDGDENENENDDGFCLYPNGIKQAIALPVNRRYQGSGSGSIGFGAGLGLGNGVLIKFSNSGVVAGRETNNKNNKRSFDDLPPPISGRYGSRNGYMKVESDGINGGGDGINGGGDGDVMNEMVLAIERLGDGFVKMERMKMDMARELESMRMKAEMKRTEMILETQQKMWDSLSETVLERREKKKVKGMVAAPES